MVRAQLARFKVTVKKPILQPSVVGWSPCALLVVVALASSAWGGAQELPGHVDTASMRSAILSEPANPGTVLKIAVALHLKQKKNAEPTSESRDQPATASKVVKTDKQSPPVAPATPLYVYDPTQLKSNQFLTTEKFQKLFSHKENELRPVLDFFSQGGCQLHQLHSNHLTVTWLCNVENLQKLLTIQIKRFFMADGRVLHANTTNPMIPESLFIFIKHINGLNQFQQTVHLPK